MKNLFSFITLLILLHTTTEARPDAVVLDTDGNEVLSGEIYYAMPLTWPGHGSGIIPYPLSNEICSYGVSQLLFGVGNPLIFKPVNSSVLGGAIYDFTDLDISFSKSIGCGASDVWKRGEYNEATGQYFIKIVGVRGNPVIETLGDAFQIRKVADDFYKFVFCPATCGSCLRKCEDVGIFPQDGVRRLAVSGDTPFFIRFRKYEAKLELARY